MQRSITFISILIICAGVVLAQSPTTAPAPGQLQKWIGDLDNADPTVRQDAKRQLMNIGHDELDSLKVAAEGRQPLTPEQIADLHDIVIQLLLSGEKQSGVGGFIGASLMPCIVPAPGQADRHGILITDRLPGFTAYPTLENGDIILSVNDNTAAVQNAPVFQQEIGRLPSGKIVNFEILRRGVIKHVSIRIGARPTWAANAFNLPEAMEMRQQQAEQYWKKTFNLSN